jgi:uncharacterized membrane protein
MLSKKDLLNLTVITLTGVIITFPSLIFGFPGGGHDSTAHLAWFRQFSEQFWGGELYPRWLINDNSGLGSPVFFYYGPIPYLISSFLTPYGAPDTTPPTTPFNLISNVLTHNSVHLS